MTEPFPNPAQSGQTGLQEDYVSNLLASNRSRKPSLAYGSISDNEPPLRRSRSLTESITNSMITATNATWRQIQRRRFLSVCVFGCFIMVVFNLIFLPRTSLDRDLRRLHGEYLTFDDCSRLFLTQLNFKNNAKSYMELLEEDVHLPGENHESIQTYFKTHFNFKTYTDKYETWVNKPVKTGLKLVNSAGHVTYEARLKESELLSFHPYSANGTVSANFVFLNYGLEQDYQAIEEQNVRVDGLIGIVRRGGASVDYKIELAQTHGVAAVLVYSDPQDDGEYTKQHGYEPFPKGPARNPGNVDKESASFVARQPGDPSTPGWSSTLFAHRVDPDTIPKIPSLPLSYDDIEPILRSLEGPSLGWTGGLDFSYSCGPSTDTLELENQVEYKIRPIYNIVNEIPGVIKDEELIIGASRDSIGGLGGASNGHAAMMELARGFDELVKFGWKPLRTIKLVSWDGSSYGLLGSTEYAEFYSNKLSKNNLVYVNLDRINGSKLRLQSHPLFNNLLLQVMKQVMVDTDHTLFEYFTEKNSTLGLISSEMGDYSVFQTFLGIPSLNIGFENDPARDPVPYYNSLSDSVKWYNTLDPDCTYPSVVAQFVGLLVLNLSEKEILHVKTYDYIAEIYRHYTDLIQRVPEYWLERIFDDDTNERLNTRLAETDTQFKTLLKKGQRFDASLKTLQRQIRLAFPWFRLLTKIKIAVKSKVANLKVRSLDRVFVAEQVVKDRKWIRHSVFAPSRDGRAASVLPGLHEALDTASYDEFVASLASINDSLAKLHSKLS
ncbi:hypothetical protein OGAPHI_007193 [Ogataea philodendri]|uniref:Vacuolar protein sorting-associated protein 70 n=1 Tax=Ogataea philodendri TaxID=1378263 RepID=A0A9P8SYS6_9ASCO|nr:uncharacterized protein OGAPHI_007193 [Ogataea philodendri]KAH3659988.1 hypothetical protein OGAPHI_007193 [Ogataea philodendri]